MNYVASQEFFTVVWQFNDLVLFRNNYGLWKLFALFVYIDVFLFVRRAIHLCNLLLEFVMLARCISRAS